MSPHSQLTRHSQPAPRPPLRGSRGGGPSLSLLLQCVTTTQDRRMYTIRTIHMHIYIMGCARLRDSICLVVILVSGLVLLLGRGRSRPRILGAVCDFYQTEIGASALVISPSISEIRAGDPQTLISIAPSLTVGSPR